VAKIEQDREEHRHNSRVEREKERERFEADLIEKKIKREKTFKMSEKTVQDTIGVKIMTIVALIYLPSTFVAVSLKCHVQASTRIANYVWILFRLFYKRVS